MTDRFILYRFSSIKRHSLQARIVALRSVTEWAIGKMDFSVEPLGWVYGVPLK